jgi:hypothetical protein
MAKDRTDYTSSRSEPTELNHVAEKKGSKGTSLENRLRDDAERAKTDAARTAFGSVGRCR